MLLGVDVFCGAGGMSLGAKMAGVEVQFAVDVDPNATATYAHNLPSHGVKTSRVEDVVRVPVRRRSVVLFGGPPCRGFSISNQRTRNRRNPANWLFREYLRLVGLVKPEWVVFENVTGILQTEGARFLGAVVRGLEHEGYLLSTWILDASEFGVPQSRKRLFVVGSRSGIAIPKPRPTCKVAVSVRDAIVDLPVLRNGAGDDELPYAGDPASAYARLMRGSRAASANHLVTKNSDLVVRRYSHVPPGGNWENIPAKLMINYRDHGRCHTGIYRRLKWDEPSIVIGNFRKNMLIHPAQNRGLSVREAARLQSFPDWYRFVGSIGFQQQQVGNAVPPLLAKAVFDQVLRFSC
jgi:DNA (cytosine-5)-methyltransferase 1